MGSWVTTAAGGGEARQRMADLAFDLIVLDVMMPEESGLELTQHVRAQLADPDFAADRDGRGRRSDPRLRERRRRLFAQAVRAARAGAAHAHDPEARRAAANSQAGRRAPRRHRVRARTSGAAPRRDPDPPDPGRGRAPDRVRRPTRHHADPRRFVRRRHCRRAGAHDRCPGHAAAAQDRADPKFPRYLQTVRGKGYVLQPD